jgi:hypothetical protein
MGTAWNRLMVARVEADMDDDEREAIRAEGLDPDDPAIRAALDLVAGSWNYSSRQRATRMTTGHDSWLASIRAHACA